MRPDDNALTKGLHPWWWQNWLRETLAINIQTLTKGLKQKYLKIIKDSFSPLGSSVGKISKRNN